MHFLGYEDTKNAFFGKNSIPNPAGGAYRAPWDTLTWSEGAKFVGKGRKREKWKGRDGMEENTSNINFWLPS